MLTHIQGHSTMSLRNRRCSCIPVRLPSSRQGLADCQRPLPPAQLFTKEGSVPPQNLLAIGLPAMHRCIDMYHRERREGH